MVEDALSRVNSLPEWHPVRIQLLNMLADFWQQDGNLLKALSYREKAVTAVEATPPGASPYVAQGLLSANGTRGIAVPGRLGAVFDPKRSVPFRRGANNGFLYQQLEDLYRQLGRPEDAAKTTAKMRALIQDDLGALANSYDRDGDSDQAIALYQKQAELAAANPQAQTWEVISPLQSIAGIYQRGS